jgi:hypothetical protein
MSNIVPFQDMQNMAESIAKSGLFGMKDTNQVLALMAVAQAEGLHPATAARDYHVIQGRPALKADAMLARFQQAGGKVDWKVYTDKEVTGLFTHPNGGSLELTWTIKQATDIGLVKPGSGWQKYPRAMLRSRCISEGIRTGCVVGTYTPEEIEEFTPPKEVYMGAVEGSKTVTITDIKEDLIEPPEGIYKLVLPDDTVYSTHATLDDWADAYVDLLLKVKNSQKMDEEAKLTKMDTLKFSNKNVTELLGAAQKAKIMERLHGSPKAHGSQSITE